MRAAIAINPEYPEAFFMLGTALKQQGELAESETALRAAIKFDPNNPGPYNTLGQLLRQKGDMERSRKAFEEGAKVKQKKEAELGKMLQKKP
jgi:Flp pilus assembly protein TadD